MKLSAEEFFKGKPVELEDMLDARERRVLRQKELIDRYGRSLLCFTMNIPGPIKNNALIRAGFQKGVFEFRAEMLRVKAPVLYEEIINETIGNEAFFVVDLEPKELKSLTCGLEDFSPFGRLYDMDVLFPVPEIPGFRKLDREEIGGEARCCMICGAPGKQCASRRIHPAAELQKKTAELLAGALMEQEAAELAELGVRALLYEVSVTPKPGLVDRENCGSHRDMDFYTYLDSCSVLGGYFRTCASLGMETAGLEAPVTFGMLRQAGKAAERHMLAATGGVNTHKGAIFTMGILLAAAGRCFCGALLRDSDVRYTAEAIAEECSRMTAGMTEAELADVKAESASTVGQRLFAEHGIRGVRGEIEAGLPAAVDFGLPMLKRQLELGKTKDEAGAAALLAMLGHMTDTNMIHRSSLAEALEERQRVCAMPETDLLCTDRVRELDREYRERNLSPGGCADMLAVCWLFRMLELR